MLFVTSLISSTTFRNVLIGVVLLLGGILTFNYTTKTLKNPSEEWKGIPSAQSIKLGEALYADNCASCHGINLEGQANWRSTFPDGSLPAPPHNEKGHTWHHPTPLLFKITKFGGQAVAPEGFNSQMPAFADVLVDPEIRSILAFIQSTWPQEIQSRQQDLTERYLESEN